MRNSLSLLASVEERESSAYSYGNKTNYSVFAIAYCGEEAEKPF